MALVESVVVNDSSGLTTHVVRTHANPIKRIVGCISRCLSLLSPKHVSRVNQASVLVSAKTAHKALRIHSCLCARDIMSSLVSDSHRLT